MKVVFSRVQMERESVSAHDGSGADDDGCRAASVYFTWLCVHCAAPEKTVAVCANNPSLNPC